MARSRHAGQAARVRDRRTIGSPLEGPPARPTIALFDIDGTLVSCGGAGRRAMDRAFADAGAPPASTEFDFGGMTDVAIARQGLRIAGLSDDEGAIASLLDRYLAFLHEEVPRSVGYQVLPGVREIVDRLLALGSIAVGLGTGNLARGAELKLVPGGLHDRFAFGGFGSDHEERPSLLRIGAERGAARVGRALSECRVIVIGDTPRDVSAAHAIGAECIAVATGRHRTDALTPAELVLEDLRDPRAYAWIAG